jgi:gene 61 protein
MSRLLITGSRAHQWTPYDSHALLIAVQEILEKTHALPILVHGGATGADTEAARAGQRLLNLPIEIHRADWNTYGRAAGPIRNKEMVNLGADLCLAFPDHPKGQGSRGTWGCIELAHQAGIPTLVVWNRRMWVYNPSHPNHGTVYTPHQNL